ncbi:hypothetical protein V8C42DRAFT_318821 [Trichoderma barbatum]
MDEDCIESSEPIFELASECEKLFSEQISRLKDEDDPNGTRVVGEYQQRFSAWAAFLGVFAVPEMCLDRRLQRHVDIQDLVLRLLDIMKRNLTYLFEAENASDEANNSDGASSSQLQLHISIESLRGIEGAIERLLHLGGTIQLSSEASQTTKLGKFAEKFDYTSFEAVARLAISSFYPDATPSLLEHLARAMIDMYQKFHYRRSRQVRLQARPQVLLSTIDEEPAPQIAADEWRADPLPASPPTENIYKRLARPIVMSHLGARSHQSRDSKPTSLDSQEFKRLFPQRKDGSVKSKTRSIAANLVAYPQPPEEGLVCDWCFSPLPEEEFKGDKWKKHLNEDFKPFLCISEKCSEPLHRFATSRDWFSHMLETHGQNWHREVHLPTWWICPLCNNQDTTYAKSQDLSEHISKLHGDVFTEQQIQIIVQQSRLRAPRPQDVCPLCCLSMKDGQEPDEDDRVLRKAFPKLSVQSDQTIESYKRIKTETGSIQLDQHSDVNDVPTEQVTPDRQTPAFQSQQPLNVETIARHLSAHLQGIMLFTLRIVALDTIADKTTDDKTLSGDTDNDLSRLGSNQQHSWDQEIEDTNEPLVQDDDNMDVDDTMEDTIPDCDDDVDWQDFIPNSEPPPETDTFLQKLIDSGSFRLKEQSPTRVVSVHNDPDKKPLMRPHTPQSTIINFPFRHDPDFTGHEALLHDLIRDCSGPPCRLAIVGIGGIGKTQLAIELAYRLVRMAKTSVFWIDAGSRSSLDQDFRKITSSSLQTSSNWLSQERNGPWVMILDGVNDDYIFSNKAYLPESQNGTIIITTRRRDVAYRLTESNNYIIEIEPMTVLEAVTLLAKKLGRTGKEPFPKSSAASGLVKSLSLIPLAICRAAAYIQYLSTGQPIEEADGDNDGRFDTNTVPVSKTMTYLPSNTLLHGDSSHPTADSKREDDLSDLFVYEDDEDDNIDVFSHGNAFYDSDMSDGVHFDKDDEVVEAKKVLPYIEEYLTQLRDTEEEKVKLLEFEVYSRDRSGQIQRTIYETWKSSFDAIRLKGRSAADLLSLMSFFDRRGIPKWLLTPLRGDGAQLADFSRVKTTLDDTDTALSKDIKMLMDHGLITANWTKQLFSMHGLVQLAVKKSLAPLMRRAFERQFIKRLAVAFPEGNYSNWSVGEELFAHVQVAAKVAAAIAVDCQTNKRRAKDWAGLVRNGVRFARLQGNYEIAMQLADEVLRKRKTKETEDVKKFDNLSLIALILMDQGQYAEAESILRQVARELETTGFTLSKLTYEVMMNNMASIHKLRGRWKVAENIQNQVAMNRISHLGLEHTKTLISKANLASIYRAQGRYAQAQGLQIEVVEGYSAKLGPGHPLALISMNNLGSIYRLRGNLSAAEYLQLEAMESLKIKLGTDNPETLAAMNCLASTYRAQGRLNEAEALQEQAMEIRTTKLGPDHPNTLASMNNLALIYSAQGKHRKAAKLQSKVVEICKVKLGPEHPHTLTSLNNIALIWKGQGRDIDGKRKMDECVETRLRVLGPNHPYTISSKAAADNWRDPS